MALHDLNRHQGVIQKPKDQTIFWKHVSNLNLLLFLFLSLLFAQMWLLRFTIA
jgi:hypothetical protein